MKNGEVVKEDDRRRSGIVAVIYKQQSSNYISSTNKIQHSTAGVNFLRKIIKKTLILLNNSPNPQDILIFFL